MPDGWLRVTAFCVYLGAWLIAAIVALVRAIPVRRKPNAAPPGITPSAIAGMTMQGIAALPITLTLTAAPLRPAPFELIATIALAGLAAALLCWTLWSAPLDPTAARLVTTGAYSWLRHPMYLAFLALLLATGLIVSARIALILAIATYIAGTELRIASEEAALEERFPAEYPLYRQNTPWRYLPGLR